MALFTPEKQALHDIIARCWVIDDRGHSATIPWKPLIVVAVLGILLGRGILPQIIPQKISDNSASGIPTETPSPSPINSSESTPSPSLGVGTIPPQVLSRLQELTLDNIQITDVATPRTYPICGAPLQILAPNNNEQLNLDWKLDWTQGGVAYVSRLKMQGTSGKMRSISPDGKGGLTTVDETMQLYTSARGLVLLGFNPIDVDTQKSRQDYKADNLIIRREIDSSVTIINCDDGGNNSSAIFTPFGNSQ